MNPRTVPGNDSRVLALSTRSYTESDVMHGRNRISRAHEVIPTDPSRTQTQIAQITPFFFSAPGYDALEWHRRKTLKSSRGEGASFLIRAKPIRYSRFTLDARMNETRNHLLPV